MMKTKAMMILGMALLLGTPSANAQSFKDRLKNAAKNMVKKAEQTVTNSAEQTVKKKVGKVVPSSISNVAKVGTASTNGIGKAAAVFGVNHTALFAPIGKAEEARLGVKSVSVTKPPKHDVDQPDWNDKRPYENELDNKSLVDEYLILQDCMDSNYINHVGPAAIRYFNVLKELANRTDKLDELVELYDETVDSYNAEYEEDRAFAEKDLEMFMRRVLSSSTYKVLIRSSLAPLFSLNEITKKDFLKKRTMEYFAAHGGYENAHKVKWTVVKAPSKK